MHFRSLLRRGVLSGSKAYTCSDFCIATLGLTNIRCVTPGIDNVLYSSLWPERKEVEQVTYSLTRESPVTRDFAGSGQIVQRLRDFSRFSNAHFLKFRGKTAVA